jgi:uncharacterized caspase-like protein
VEEGRAIAELDSVHVLSTPQTVAWSPDGRYVAAANGVEGGVWSTATGALFHRWTWDTRSYRTILSFTPDSRHLVVMPTEEAGAYFYNVEANHSVGADRKEALIVSFRDSTWAVVDPEGRFDASNGGDVEGLHWVVEMEPVDLRQLKERYYDPGLLAKVLGYTREPLREVQGFGERGVGLYPGVKAEALDDGRLQVELADRGGGIGAVVVRVNGREVAPDGRPREARNADRDTLSFALDLATYDRFMLPGDTNFVEVLAANGEGYIICRGVEVEVVAEGEAPDTTTALWAVVVGVSDYTDERLDLRYAAKDAADFAAALRVAAGRLFDARVHVTLLADAEGADGLPTQANLLRALDVVADTVSGAKPGDVFVLYLAGHGAAHGGAEADFYFLTREAYTGDLTDPAVRDLTAVSGREITRRLQRIPALKQVLILDTCHSGAVATSLSGSRERSFSQLRALERMKDRVGLFVLSGSAADAVSYEASRYGQGLLTYSLLFGMSGADLWDNPETEGHDRLVSVSELLGKASERVPGLAEGIGGIQQPVVTVPRAASTFYLGQVMPGDLSVATPRPVVLRVRYVQDEDAFGDHLGLTARLNAALHEASTRGAEAPLMFVDAEEMDGAFSLVGRYRVDGEQVRLTVRLFRGDEPLDTLTLSGRTDDLDGLAARLLDDLAPMLTESE